MKYFLLFLLPFSLFAQLPDKGDYDPLKAAQYLEQKEAELEKWTTVKAPKGSEQFNKKDTATRAVLDKTIDYDFIAKFVLGEKWEKSPADKKDELFRKFKQLLSDFYLEEIFYNKSYEKKYISKALEKNYVKGVPQSVSITTEVQVILKNKPVIYEVVYHMHKKDNGNDYMIFDIELDSVSLIHNYKTQFSKTMKDQDIDELIKKIDNKLKNKDKNKSGK